MGETQNNIAEPGLQFFGKISASMSHEIKNVLAIINENAGLLEDFTLMADRGMPIDPARLKGMAETVKKQISRADEITKNINRLAHSTDHTFATVDLAETTELVIALTARFAAMKGVKIDVNLPEHPVKFRTTPFSLYHLLWLCLDFAMSVCGEEKKVELDADESEGKVRFQFGQLAGVTESMQKTFPSDREKILLNGLAAELITDIKNAQLVLQLSKD